MLIDNLAEIPNDNFLAFRHHKSRCWSQLVNTLKLFFIAVLGTKMILDIIKGMSKAMVLKYSFKYTLL